MRTSQLRWSGFARVLAAFALLAMVARALVPAGYMIAPAQDGRFVTIILCSAQGGAEAVIDVTTGAILDAGADHEERAPPADSKAAAPCVFATAAPLAAPVAVPPISFAFRQVFVEAAIFPESTVRVGLAAPPPQSTGPPLTA